MDRRRREVLAVARMDAEAHAGQRIDDGVSRKLLGSVIDRLQGTRLRTDTQESRGRMLSEARDGGLG